MNRLLPIIVLLFFGYVLYSVYSKQDLKEPVKQEQPAQNTQDTPDRNLMRLTCPACAGTGRAVDAVNKTRICFVCRGSGSKVIRRPKSGEDLCPSCGGMGKRLYRTADQPLGYVRCSYCEGKGIVSAK